MHVREKFVSPRGCFSLIFVVSRAKDQAQNRKYVGATLNDRVPSLLQQSLLFNRIKHGNAQFYHVEEKLFLSIKTWKVNSFTIFQNLKPARFQVKSVLAALTMNLALAFEIQSVELLPVLCQSFMTK